MPVVLVRTVEVSSIRCRSPVDSDGTGPVEGQVAEPDVEQRREPAVQLGEQADGHPAELGGQPGGQAGREPVQLAQAERADLGDDCGRPAVRSAPRAAAGCRGTPSRPG